jgi:hypothetical protein
MKVGLGQRLTTVVWRRRAVRKDAVHASYRSGVRLAYKGHGGALGTVAQRQCHDR